MPCKQRGRSWSMETRILFCALILGICQFGYAQEDEPKLEDDIFRDLDVDLKVAPRRERRQVKTILTKESKPHMTELTVKTTIISRYAFTAVYCKMFNRHASAAEGTFHFQIPVAAYVSNFTISVRLRANWRVAKAFQSNQLEMLLSPLLFRQPDGDLCYYRSHSLEWIRQQDHRSAACATVVV